ncbi:MAG TPA: thiamine pyrophosphate-dependent enzyme [Vicinamibacteria bacterium]
MRMTGGEALVASLVREGVEVLFGLPGVQIYGVLAALRNEPRIRFITTRHEQSTTFMADGYARASGKAGAALVVPGPGLLNAASGLATAYACSSPVLLIAGQVPRTSIDRGIGQVHEVVNQLDAIRPVTKWRKRVLEVTGIPSAIRDAFRELRSGRPRPVAIEMPPEVMEENGDVSILDPIPVACLVPPAADLDRAAAILRGSRAPVFYAGGGVHASGAQDALRALAERLEAGVVASTEGKGSVSDESDLSLGSVLWADGPLRRHFASADVVLAVGTRLALARPRPDQQVIQIDVDADEIGRNHAKTLGLLGDARATLESLLARLPLERESRKLERERLRAEIAATADQEPQATILGSLRAAAPRETLLVPDMTQIGYYSRPFWPVYEGRTYLSSSYSQNLGFAYPAALGAKVARPDRPVLALCGDGGFLYNAQELATAVQHGIHVVVVLFNDASYGNVARDMDESFGGSLGAELRNPDFVKLAEAYGVSGARVTTAAELGDRVREALARDESALIEMPVGRMSAPRFFPKLPARARSV